MIPQNEQKIFTREITRQETLEEVIQRARTTCYRFCTKCGFSTEGLEWHPIKYHPTTGKVLRLQAVGTCRTCQMGFDATVISIDYIQPVYPVYVQRPDNTVGSYEYGNIVVGEEPVTHRKKFLGIF